MTGAPGWHDLKADLAALYAAAIGAADPVASVRRALVEDDVRLALRSPEGNHGRLLLVAAGKAARGMAIAAATELAQISRQISGGVVAYPHGAPPVAEAPPLPANVVQLAGAHPVPDEGSLAAGEAVRRLLAQTQEDDVVLVLLSGGASSVLELPPDTLSLDALRRTTAALQHAGADICELNTVRRAISRIKGGGLARWAAPARVVTLALSDVVGDPPEAIGSGPTVRSPTGPAEALTVLARTGVGSLVPEVVAHLETAAVGGREPDPPAGLYRIVASNRHAAEAVANTARARGWNALVMTTFLSGEAREAGRWIGGCAASVAAHGLPLSPPACLIFGGETTVTVRGTGRGGRNQELALGAALLIADRKRTAVLSFATDGVDGSSDTAGALATGETVARAASLGLSPERALADNDSRSFFAALGDAWGDGPTGTNLNDLAIALVYP